MPIILNAANERAVEAFLERRLGFTAIPAAIERALDAGERRLAGDVQTLAGVREVDAWARQFTELIRGLESGQESAP